MSTTSVEEYRARIRKLLALLADTKASLETMQEAASEPIAVVGIACRLPGGACSPSSLWDNLLSSRDSIVKIPPHRWPLDALPERLRNSGWAGLVDDIDCFDADFFSISPREASALDPQQRLLLELSWEALEAAGQPQDLLVGSRTGVFVGMTSMDYHTLTLDKEIEQLGAHDFTGTFSFTAAGRVSYWFGLQGPCMVVDTACSSSLVALHLACQSLRSGESSLALAAGVNALLSPKIMALMAATNTLSPDSRCKTFDASANGLVRSEGGAVVVLKRLSDALKNHDPIVCLIRGSAVNQDGRSSDLTAPNVLSQQLLLRQALASAHLSAQDIGLVETHGTGTSLGDPIEVEALKAVYGGPRADQTHCYLGALKSNLGHLEAASGIAGLIKAALCLSKEAIPKNLHFKTLNPRISLDQTPLVIPTTTIPWPAGPKPRRAGVSAFGIGGTNAHMIVEEAPRRSVPAAAQHSSYLVPLSAKSPQSLLAMAKSYAEYLSRSDESLHDIAYTASVRRTHQSQRLTLIASSKAELVETLTAYGRGELPDNLLQGVATADRPKLVFVFPGQGAQWLGMGRSLLETEPVFSNVIQCCDTILQQLVSWSINRELLAVEQSSRLADTDVAQPVLVAIEIALAELLKSWGIVPDAVIGHSVGELAAAHIAGHLSLAATLRIAVLRGRLMHKAVGRGQMAAVALPVDEVLTILGDLDLEGQLDIAAVNAPSAVVLSGAPDALKLVRERLASRGVETRPLRVNYAFHSPQMDALLPKFLDRLGNIQLQPAMIPMFSTVTGRLVGAEELRPKYWAQNIRQTVLFAPAVQSAIRAGNQIFLEVGPHPVLTMDIDQCARGEHMPAHALFLLRRAQDERRCLLKALGKLHIQGYPLDWSKLYPQGGTTVGLPRYPWQHDRYWMKVPAPTGRSSRVAGPRLDSGHPLLGAPIPIATQPDRHLFQQQLSMQQLPFLADHQVHGEIVVPGVAYIEMALSAAQQVFRCPQVALSDLKFERFLTLAGGANVVLQFDATQADAEHADFTISARGTDQPSWQKHAVGRLGRSLPAVAPTPSASLEVLRGRIAQSLQPEDLYQAAQAQGFRLGPAFRGLLALWRSDEEALAAVRLPEAAGLAERFLIHPALLDACGQAAAALILAALPRATSVFVPVGVERVHLLHSPGQLLWAHARRSRTGSESPSQLSFDITIFNESGEACLLLSGFHIALLSPQSRARSADLDRCVYRIDWQPAELAPAAARRAAVAAVTYLVLSDSTGLAEAVAATLGQQGHRCVQVLPAADFARPTRDSFLIDPLNQDHYRRLLAEALAEGEACVGVLHLWSLDVPAVELAGPLEAVAPALHSTVSAALVAQALMDGNRDRGGRRLPRLFLITRGAQSAGDSAAPPALGQAPLWGLGRTLALEQPELGCRLIDLSASVGAGDAQAVLDELTAPGHEGQVALRAQGRLVARLVRTQLDPAPQSSRPAGSGAAPPRSFRPQSDATYLITGGLSGLGLALAQALVADGARHLVLISRSQPDAATASALAAMQKAGAEILPLCADVAEPCQMAAVFAQVRAQLPPLRGIVHCAGVIDDHLLAELSLAHFAQVFAPKVFGVLVLHALSVGEPLDFFIVYSSVASTLGSPGQANYSAANAFLDAFAHARTGLGQPTMSIQWGPFAAVGLAAANAGRRPLLAEHGLDPEESYPLISRLLAHPRPEVMVLRGSVKRLLAHYPAESVATYLSCLTDPVDAASAPPEQGPRLLQRLRTVAPDERAALLAQSLRAVVAQVLGIDPRQLNPEALFHSYGLDSLLGLELRNLIEQQVGLQLTAAAIWTYGSVARLTAHLMNQLTPAAPPDAAAGGQDVAAQMMSDIGLVDSLPQPGEATDLAALPTPKAILLTGSTGFIGLYLLDRLLRHTAADLYCLVRAASAPEALSRLRGSLDAAGLWKDQYTPRLFVVCGDLALPGFGLSDERFRELCECIDFIIHNGAKVNWVQSYFDLRPVNVLGTLEVLRLSQVGRRKPIHYISTSAVTWQLYTPYFSQTAGPQENEFLEQVRKVPSALLQQLDRGYRQTKWAADELLLRARSRGFPVTLYRVPFVCGDSRTGVWNTKDFLSRMFKACVELQAVPKQDAYIDTLPVDYVADLIVDLALQGESVGKVFHLSSPKGLHWSSAIAWLREQGYHLEEQEPGRWLSGLRNYLHQDADQNTHALLPILEALPTDRLLLFVAYPSLAGELLARLTTAPYVSPPYRTVPELNEAALARLFQYFHDVGFIKWPPGRAGRPAPVLESGEQAPAPRPALLLDAEPSDWQKRKFLHLYRALACSDQGALSWDSLSLLLAKLQQLRRGDDPSAGGAAVPTAGRRLWEALASHLDNDHDGIISAEDFLRLIDWARHDIAQIGKLPQWLFTIGVALYALMDVRQRGQLAAAEYSNFLAALGCPSESAAEFARLDLNRDGAIDMEEMEELYIQWLLSTAPEDPGNFLFGSF